MGRSRRFFDTHYCIRKNGEQLKLGDSPVFINTDNFTIKGTVFRGTEGLWELLTRRNVNRQIIGKDDIKTRNISNDKCSFEYISAWR